jgi:hypothetical protein
MADHSAEAHFAQAIGVVTAGLALIRAGRLHGIIEGVQAETVSEVLAQADSLVASGHALAATVLAGGALETHLLHLCTRNGLGWNGDGSIAKYDGAIAQARNNGVVRVYETIDTHLIGGWGSMRNTAAHDPTNYRRTVDEVRGMIDGIRQFIARVP